MNSRHEWHSRANFVDAACFLPADDALGHPAVAENLKAVAGTYVFNPAVKVVIEFPSQKRVVLTTQSGWEC